MKELIARLMRKPWIAHIIAAVQRFGKRLGPQFAGSITYFSVLSMIPVLLFGIAVSGFVVTVFRPDLLTQVQNIVQEQLGSVTGTGEMTETPSTEAEKARQDFADTMSNFVTETFNEWRTIGITALVAAAYAGSRWVKNLKHAVRAMWKESFADAAKKGSFLGELFSNLIIFFGLLLSIAIAVAVTAAGQAFPEEIIGWIGAEDIPGINTLVSLASLLIGLLASWMLFAFLFIVLPGERTRKGTFIRGTLAGAVLFTALQQLAGVLVGIFSGNASAGVFGPIIILMLVFNALATIILMISAWVGTADTWEAARAQKDAEEAAGVEAKDETGIDDDRVEKQLDSAGVSAPALSARRRADRWAAERDLDSLRAVNYDPAKARFEDSEATVKQDVAARSVRVGTGVGYGVGAATGIGLGAIIAAVVGKMSRH